MEKIKNKKENLELLKNKLYNINIQCAGSSIVADSTALFLLEILEKYESRSIAKEIKNFFEDNMKYSYIECTEIINGIINRCDEYILNMEENSNIIFEKYLDFIDEFNKYDLEYKIKKNQRLEISKLEEMQKQIKIDVKEANIKYDKISNKIDKLNYDLIGTISLFSGVIFALYGGFKLSTSVFDYIGSVNFIVYHWIYRNICYKFTSIYNI